MKRIYHDTMAIHALDHSQDIPVIIEDEKKDFVSADDALLKIVYAVDPVTLLPTGDLQVFMSADTSPEVKEYISRNLMRPNGEAPKATGLSVDEMHALSRHPGESRDAYVSRMNEYFYNMKQANKPVESKSE